MPEIGARSLNKNLLIIFSVVILTVLGIGLYSGLKSAFRFTTIFVQTVDQPESVAAIETETETAAVVQKFSNFDKNTRKAEKLLNPPRKCSAACQSRILMLLSTGEPLTSVDATLIVQNADLFASLLSQSPEKLADLLSTLQEDEGDSDHAQFAAQAVWVALTDDDRARAGLALLGHSNADFRVIGVKLSSAGVTDDLEVAQAFGRLIQSETDSRVLITALNTLNLEGEIGPYTENALTALDQIIALHESDYIRGHALLAKAKTAITTTDTAVDIRRALQGSSSKYRGFGLRALSVTLDRRNSLEETSRFHWTRDHETQDMLKAIIDNPDVQPKQRQLASELLEMQ